MQYSALNLSTLIAVFSASTALAYLDCGGGRAPPKTTVPGCPGYIEPTAVVTVTATASTSVVVVTATATLASADEDYSDEDSYYSDEDTSYGNYYNEDGLCKCSGYLCEYAEPGCVAVNKDGTSSTITANPGWMTKNFDVDEYYSYIATAGPDMYYSSDGYLLSYTAVATELLSMASEYSEYTTKTTSKSASKTSTKTTGAATTTTSSQPEITSSSMNATVASTLSTVASTTASSNITAVTSATEAASTNGAARTSGLSSLAALIVFGVGAAVLL